MLHARKLKLVPTIIDKPNHLNLKKPCIARLFFAQMALKLDGIYYLNRNETIEYLMHAYDLKWCITKWENGKVKISYEKQSSQRAYYYVTGYKIKSSKKVHLSKRELDVGMCAS